MASHSDQASTVPLRLPLVVAMVAQRYRFSLVPARPVEVEAAVTLRRRPVLMRSTGGVSRSTQRRNHPSAPTGTFSARRGA
jgi:hypothetical protein